MLFRSFHKRERIVPQTVSMDLEIGISNDAVFRSDLVADCIDYDIVTQRIRALMQETQFNLVETLAQRVADILLDEFGASYAKISIAKLGILKNTDRVGVQIERHRNDRVVGRR